MIFRTVLFISSIFCGSIAFSQWAAQTLAPTQLILGTKMAFWDDNNGVLVGTNAFPNGSAQISRTTDGAATWNLVYSLPPATTPSFLTLNDVQYASASVVYASGGYADPIPGVILKSINGGLSWDTLSHLLPENKFLSLYFLDVNTGFVGGGNNLYRTNDGGLSWNQVTLPSGVSTIEDIEFTSMSNGYLVNSGTGGLLTTNDGGSTWTAVSLPTSETAIRVEFFDGNNGLIGCENGVILYTHDGGATWSAGSNPDPDLSDISSITMTSPTTCYIGAQQRILHSLDGGQVWTESVNITTLSPPFLISVLYDLEFPSPQVGYGSGQLLSLIIKTTNGGGVSIPEFEINKIDLWPNPANNTLNFSNAENGVFEIRGIDGVLIEQVPFQMGTQSIDISHLPTGTYLAHIQGSRHLSTGIFVKD